MRMNGNLCYLNDWDFFLYIKTVCCIFIDVSCFWLHYIYLLILRFKQYFKIDTGSLKSNNFKTRHSFQISQESFWLESHFTCWSVLSKSAIFKKTISLFYHTAYNYNEYCVKLHEISPSFFRWSVNQCLQGILVEGLTSGSLGLLYYKTIQFYIQKYELVK